jgi:Family of unknown function (DUF5715)
MVRIAFTTLLLVALAVSSASAVRITAVQPRAHASITKSTAHRSRRSSPATTSHSQLHSSRAAAGTTRKSTTPARASHSTTRRGTHYTSSSNRRIKSSTVHAPTTLRRARYNRYHSAAHFVPASTVTAASSRSGTMNIAREQSTEYLPTETSAETATYPRPAPRPADSTPVANAAAAEADTSPAPGTDPATLAAAGNPLAAPRESRQPIGPTSGQVAELNRPPIITGRVSSYTLRGTHDSLVRQNARAEEDSLERIEDDADLQDRIARGLLVRVPESSALTVNPSLPENRRYCRPWTASFLTDLARAHQSQFHSPLFVSSAVRTVEYQKQLMRINGNAAEAEGDIVSPHLTGGTIDIAKSGLSRKEMLWMRNQLLGYQNAGVIDVEEEFHQRCFHITVYKNYGSGALSRPSKVATAPVAPVDDTFDANSAVDATPNNR